MVYGTEGREFESLRRVTQNPHCGAVPAILLGAGRGSAQATTAAARQSKPTSPNQARYLRCPLWRPSGRDRYGHRGTTNHGVLGSWGPVPGSRPPKLQMVEGWITG